MKRFNQVSIADIKMMQERLHYNDINGELRWKLPTSNRIRAGMRAGRTHENGHIEVRLENRYYMAHHVAWAIFYGAFPDKPIKHLNGNKSDNRLDNLSIKE